MGKMRIVYQNTDHFLHPQGQQYSKDLSIRTFNLKLRVRAFFHKTVRVCHVYCNFKIGFMCRITVIFGTLKDGSLLINNLAFDLATETYIPKWRRRFAKNS